MDVYGLERFFDELNQRPRGMPRPIPPPLADLELLASQMGFANASPLLECKRNGLIWELRRDGNEWWALTEPLLEARSCVFWPLIRNSLPRRESNNCVKLWPGSQAAWPIGLMPKPSGKRASLREMKKSLAIVSSPADLIAAWHFIIEQDAACRPFLMLGNLGMPLGMLHRFRGRRVRIFPRVDNSEGMLSSWGVAMQRARQLEDAGASVDVFSLSGLRQHPRWACVAQPDGELIGAPVGSLWDVVKMTWRDYIANKQLTSMMRF